jgi:hypothetical protein
MEMKTPTKSELYAQVDALTKENIALQEKLDAEEHERWLRNRDIAYEAFYKQIPFRASEMWNATLDHVDKAGYWFTFELRTDSTRQTYCVRHTDL